MPSNKTYVCVPCREAKKSDTGFCLICKGPLVVMSRWSAPRKNNNRAWKRIESGEWLWDRRKAKMFRANDQRMRDRIGRSLKGHRPGFNRTGNYTELPNVDLGG